MQQPMLTVFETKPTVIKKHSKKVSKHPDLTSHKNEIEQLGFLDLPPVLDGWIRLYLRLQIEGIKSPSTVSCVRRDLTRFENFFREYVNEGTLVRWQPRVTTRFLNQLEAEGLRPATITRTLASVRAFGKWVKSVRPDFFPLGDPTAGARPPIQDALRPKGLTDKQIKLLLDAAYHLICKNYPSEELAVLSSKSDWRIRSFRTIRRPLRDYAILVLMLNAGIRREEACNLNFEQLQGRKLVNVKCKGNVHRDVLLGNDTLQVINNYIETERPRDAEALGNSPALFLPSKSRMRGAEPGRLSVKAINRIIEQITQEANRNLPDTERFQTHPHALRHTHAYKLLEKGRDLSYVQRRLGHQSMTYLARYTQIPEEQEQQLLNDLEII